MNEKDTIVRYEPVPREQTDGGTDWDRIDAMTDEEAELAARSDPDNPPLTPEQLARMRRMPNVQQIRKAQGLSQTEFAERFAIPVSAIRDWEQGRYNPPAAVITLLNVIEYRPEAVIEAISAARKA